MGALRGYFVKPEMKRALEGSVKTLADGLPGFLSPMYKAFLGAKGASALAKTVFSPITQVRNAAGGFFFTAANGSLGRSGNFVKHLPLRWVLLVLSLHHNNKKNCYKKL